MRDVLSGTKPQQTYLKKYSAVGKHKSLQLNDIRSIGWQILKALEFLHSKGLTHGGILVHTYINLKPDVKQLQEVYILATFSLTLGKLC